MTEYDKDITYNGVYLKITSLSPIRTQKNVKQIMGKSLTQTKVLGVNDQQWQLSIQGVIVGTTATNLSDNRAAIEGLDSDTPYTYIDGIHNGTYIVNPGTLKIDDKASNVGLHYTYAMNLIEQ